MTSMSLDEFVKWGSQYKDFPAGIIGYWVEAAKRADGKDMYGRRLTQTGRS